MTASFCSWLLPLLFFFLQSMRRHHGLWIMCWEHLVRFSISRISVSCPICSLLWVSSDFFWASILLSLLLKNQTWKLRLELYFLAFWYLLYVNQDWFEQYRERVTDAEQMILTTLNFELSVQHPYDPLTSILNKLGLSQTVLVNLSLSLVSEG